MARRLAYRPAARVPFRIMPAEAGEQAVIVDPSENSILTLNHTGTTAWKVMGERGATRDEIVDALAREFRVDRAELERDVDAFLETMVRRGFVEAGDD